MSRRNESRTQYTDRLLSNHLIRIAAWRRALLGVTGLLSLFAATPASADYGTARVIHVAPIEIRVASNGSEYTGISGFPGSINGLIQVEIGTGFFGGVKFWKTWPKIRQIQGTWIEFENFGSSQTYPIGQRPDAVDKAVPFMIPQAVYRLHAVAACNIHAAQRRTQGWSDWKIFANDRTVKLAVSEELSWDTSGPKGTVPPPEVDGGEYPEVTVICERDPNAPTAEDLEPELHPIENVSLTAEVIKSVIGECSLRLSGSITARETGRSVKFRYVGDGDEQSPVQTVFIPVGQATVEFEHSFPMNFNEKKDRSIKMVGVDPPFDSDNAHYESCDAPLTNEAAVLPPKAKSMGLVVREEILRNGLACPSVVEVEGYAEGRGQASGKIVLGAGGGKIYEGPYSFTGNEVADYAAEHELSWPNEQATKQSINIGIYLYNSLGAEVDRLEGTKHVECYEPQPPKAVSLDMIVIQEAGHNGMICPVEIEARSILKGGGGVFSGTASFTANTEESAPLPVSMTGQSNLIVTETFPVSWQGISGLEQDVALSVSIRDADGVFVTTRPGSGTLQCRKALEVESVSFLIPKSGEKMYDGMACPTVVEYRFEIISGGVDFAGSAIVQANAAQIGEEAFSVSAEGSASSHTLEIPHQVSWQGVGTSEQTVQFAVRLLNMNGEEVGSRWGETKLSCREVSSPGQHAGVHGSEGSTSGPGTVPGAANSASGGRLALGEIATAPSAGRTTIGQSAESPGPKQQGRRPATAVGRVALAPTPFAILAPKGRLRPGPRAEIRLSGTVPEGGYSLRFYRKDKGRYKLVRIASLPQSMEGNRQVLRINALRGSTHWRVEVCPAGASGQSCKTSDFTLARGRGSGQGAQEPEIMVITPGAINTN